METTHGEMKSVRFDELPRINGYKMAMSGTLDNAKFLKCHTYAKTWLHQKWIDWLVWFGVYEQPVYTEATTGEIFVNGVRRDLPTEIKSGDRISVRML